MTPEIPDYKPGLLAETNKYIEVSDGHLVTEKQTGEPQIKMCGNNGKPFIAMFYKYHWHQTCAIDYFPLLGPRRGNPK